MLQFLHKPLIENSSGSAQSNKTGGEGLLNQYFVGDSTSPLKFRFSGVLQYIPLIICGGFFLFTILVFVFGPFDWKINNGFNLYSFLFFSVLALVTGYILAVKKGKVTNSKLNVNTNNILILCAFVYLILYIPTVFSATGKLYPDFITGLTNAGKAYQNAKYYNTHGFKLVAYIRMLLSPFLIMVMPVTLFFMPKLSKIGRFFGFTVLIGMVLLGISQGINKVCADFTGQIVLFLVLLFFSNYKKGLNVQYKLKILGLIVLVCGSFFIYFSSTMHSRVAMDNEISSKDSMSQGSTGSSSSSVSAAGGVAQENPSSFSSKNVASSSSEKDVDSTITKYATFSYATERNNPLYNLLPAKIKPTALFLSSYVTHGYKGLSIAMNQEFTSSYGLGFSDFFRHNFLKLIGKSNQEKQIYNNNTYPGKTIRVGWETGAVWSTFFVYPASDITFVGTIFLVFIIGYLFALAWKDALKTENPFAIVVFFNFCIMVFYFPANNQLFQGGESFIGFTVVFIAWLVSRHIAFKKANGNSI